MKEPLAALFNVLGRGVEKIGDHAFEVAVAKNRDKEAPTEQEQLLELVRRGEATPQTPGIQQAIRDGLVKKDASDNKLLLTASGEYQLPGPEEESALRALTSPQLS